MAAHHNQMWARQNWQWTPSLEDHAGVIVSVTTERNYVSRVLPESGAAGVQARITAPVSLSLVYLDLMSVPLTTGQRQVQPRYRDVIVGERGVGRGEQTRHNHMTTGEFH